jgi:hypothetical protein
MPLRARAAVSGTEAGADAAVLGIAPHIAARSRRPVSPECRHRHARRHRRTRRQFAGQHPRQSVSAPCVPPPSHAGFQANQLLVLDVSRPQACSVRRVIPEIDIWRAANLMLKRYGDKAFEESSARADELAAAGDDDGAATWRRITDAVVQLANNTPPGPVH